MQLLSCHGDVSVVVKYIAIQLSKIFTLGVKIASHNTSCVSRAAARSKVPSRSKKRRINRQAHLSRLDETLKQERKRKAVETGSMSWKKEALLLKRSIIS